MVSSLQPASTTAPWQQPIAERSPEPASLKHIMVISSAIALVEELQIELSYAGYQVSVIHDGLRGLLTVQRFSPDLVMVDWSPPRLSGLEICDRLRVNNGKAPVILLTPGNNAEDRIAGFAAGADDCVSLPFIKEELFARINSKLTEHHCPPVEKPILRCADIVLNRKTREVLRDNSPVHLTAKEFDLLECLMAHYFQVLTRSEILEEVWGYDYTGNSNIIEVYIRYLRNKLDNARDHKLIQTVRGVGYILRESA